MSYLVFCSFEVGGLPFKMAEILNRHGYRTYYVSIHKDASGHNSTSFHYHDTNTDWNISHQFKNFVDSDKLIVSKLKEVRKQHNIQGCLATGSKSFLVDLAGIDYVYWSFGSDLDQHCFARGWPEGAGLYTKFILTITREGQSHREYFRKLRKEQRRSIRCSRSIVIAPYQVDSYKRICPNKPKSFFPHYFPQTDYEDIIIQKRNARNAIYEELGITRFIFSSTRHHWAGNNQLMSDNKGNHVVLRSFARYLELTSDHETRLLLVRKGPDVSATVDLARELKLSDKILWLDEMNREKLQSYYSAAHIAFGQFGNPVLAFSALEPLTAATPCVSFFLDGRAQQVPFYAALPPIFNSQDPLLIAEYLARLLSDKGRYDQASRDAWQWIQDNCLESHFVKTLSSNFQLVSEKHEEGNGAWNGR